MMGFKRRRFLEGAAAGGAAAGLVRAPARAAEFEYKLGDTDAPDHPINLRLVQFANAVKEETNGRMAISVFPYNQLGSATAMLSQLRQGAIQFLQNLSGSFTGVVPIAAIDSVSFAFSTQQEAWATMDGPLGAYVRKEFAARGIYAFEKMWDIGLREVTSSTHPIRTAADFTGFKIRTPPAKISVDLFRTLGASPTALESSEMYTALQTHLVDGQETPPAIILTERLYEVQKYLSLTNHAWAGHWMVANADAWNALPPDIRTVIDRNAVKYAVLERNDMLRVNAASINVLKARGMIVNMADASSMRVKLVPYYARWKDELGSTAWSMLEAKAGKLG